MATAPALMPMWRAAAGWLMIAGALSALGGCGDSQRVRLRFEGDRKVDRAELSTAARRELADFQEHPSEAALADAAYAMEQELRQQGFAHGRVRIGLHPSEEQPEVAVFQVDEGPRAYLEQLEFPGATRFSEERLRGLLKAEGVGLFRLFDPPFRRRDLQGCREAVEALYLMDGYYRVRLERPEVVFSEDRKRARARIAVEEGRRYLVGSVAIEADLAGSGMVRADLDQAVAGADIVGDAYHARLPALAAARIRQWLADRGRLDATVAPRSDIDDESATVAVTYAVRPGPRYVLREVVVNGIDRTKPGFVRKRLDSDPWQPISSGGVDEGIRRLTRSGAFSSVRWRVVPVDGPAADVGPGGELGPAGVPGLAGGGVSAADVGPGGELGPAGVPGLAAGRVSAAGVGPGDELGPAGIPGLAEGSASAADVGPGGELGPAGVPGLAAGGGTAAVAGTDRGATRLADLVLTVTEAQARSLDFEVGYGTYELLRGGIRYRDRNLFGQGRFWEVRPSTSLKSWGAESRVRDDYLVGKNNVAELSGGYQFRREPTFDRDTWTGTASLEHRFDKDWTTRGGYIYKAARARAIERPIAGAEESGFVSSARVFWGVRYDQRDSVVMPTRGLVGGARLAYSAPYVGSDLNFLEYDLHGSAFVPAHERLVLGIDGRYTTRDVLDDSGSLPIQERLFAGGENSVRSYREAEVLPEGGLTSAVASAEARYQLRGRVWTALFYDIGQVNRGAWRLDGTVGQAVGLGLRYQLPVGPIRLDVAYNPDRPANKLRAYMGQFAVGFSF